MSSLRSLSLGRQCSPRSGGSRGPAKQAFCYVTFEISGSGADDPYIEARGRVLPTRVTSLS